jgi:hypothetical protein
MEYVTDINTHFHGALKGRIPTIRRIACARHFPEGDQRTDHKKFATTVECVASAVV